MTQEAVPSGQTTSPPTPPGEPFYLLRLGSKIVAVPEWGSTPPGWAAPARYARAQRRKVFYFMSNTPGSSLEVLRAISGVTRQFKFRARRLVMWAPSLGWRGVVFHGVRTTGDRKFRSRAQAERWL